MPVRNADLSRDAQRGAVAQRGGRGRARCPKSAGGIRREFRRPLAAAANRERADAGTACRAAGRQRTVDLGVGTRDRKSVVSGKSVSVRVDIGGRRILKKKKISQKQ